MATLFGVSATLYESDSPARFAGVAEQQGVVQSVSDVFEFAAASIADIVLLGRIPANCSVISAKLYFDALGASTTLAMGSRDVADITANLDVDRFITAAATSSAGILEMDEGEITSGVFYSPTNEQQIYVTLAGGAATGTLKSILRYTWL